MSSYECDLEHFSSLTPGCIFRIVETAMHSVIFEGPDRQAPVLRFVCKKGYGYNDWAIYYSRTDRPVQWTADHGDKVTSERNIRAIFPCSDELFARYRY